jgi:hypothetical protein
VVRIRGDLVSPTGQCRVIPTVIKDDRWDGSLFGAPPPANPANDTNRWKRWEGQRFAGWYQAALHAGRGNGTKLSRFRHFDLATSPTRSAHRSAMECATGRAFSA